MVLTAHSTRNDDQFRIVSRVNEAAWLERITAAGADVAQSPYPSYGTSLAAAAISPAVLDLHDLPLLALGTEEIAIAAGSLVLGLTARDLALRHPYVHIIGLRRDDRLHRWHEVDSTLIANDVLVVLGGPEHLVELANEVTGVPAASEPA